VSTSDERIGLAVALACRTSPQLDPEVAREAIEAAARSGRERNLLSEFLREHSDGFSSGLSSAPLVVGRVVDSLRSAGATNMVKPRCASCDIERKLPYIVESGRICVPCFIKANAKECIRCRQTRPVACATASGPICSRCHVQDPSRHEPCVRCGRVRQVTRRTDEGPLCSSCYERPKARCDACGRQGKIHSRRSGSALCDRCYRSPQRPCGVCGEIGVILRRAGEKGDVDTCERCYTPPLVECAGCSRVRPCSALTEQGPLCQACAPRPVHVCSRCGEERPAQQLTEDGPICSPCYDRIRRVPCRSCGERCRPYERGRCAKCVLSTRVEELLSDGTGIRSDLEPLAGAIRSASQPVSMLNWLRHSEGTEILSRLATGEVELSHEGLDDLPRTKPLDHLRSLLIASGLLPEVAIEFDRLEPWLDALLADVPKGHARTLRAFASWKVFRRARRKADRGTLSENGVKWARLRVRQALAFLEWLDGHGIQLEGLAQRDVDLWLAGGPTTRYVVRDFLAWARARRLAPPVKVPLRQVLSPAQPVDDDERWEQVDRLLSDDTVELDVRVAGLFALLYGQHLSRVSRLRRQDLIVESGRVAIRFGEDMLVLPPGLDQLAVQLLERRGHALVQGDTAWLFPGGTPGRPITAERFRGRLADVGIPLRPTRQAALLQLAAEMPAPVLADLLGLHANTAVEWVRAARGDWSAYAAAGTTGDPARFVAGEGGRG